MNPEETHAIVVGIEQYSIPNGSWNLNGPAVDATRFVQWLRGRGVPAKNIRLFAQSIDDNKSELAAIDVTSEPADDKTILDAFTDDFANRRGELLFLFWGGHGVVGDNERRLFFSNVRENNLRNLNVNSLLQVFRSTFLSSFDKQVFFVDACANYFELQQSPVGLAEIPVVPGMPRPAVAQFVLFSASAGERAKNVSALRTGLFSHELVEELKKSPATEWPPDLPLVESHLDQRFDELRAEGKANQTPVHFYSQGWAGGVKNRYASNHPELGPGEHDLADALSACPLMQTSTGRVQILAELFTLGVNAVNQITLVADKNTHIEIMVSVLSKSRDRDVLIERVLSREQKGTYVDELKRVRLEIRQQLFDHANIRQLRDLLLPLQLQQPDVLRLFGESASSLIVGARQESVHPYWLLLTLAGFPFQNEGFPYPALLFAEKLAAIVPKSVADGLRRIVDQAAAQRNASDAIREFRTGTAWQPSNGKSVLVFEMKPKAGGFVLRAFLINAGGQWSPLQTDDNPVSESVARDKFRDLVSQVEELSTNLIIEMVLAREMFCEPVDRWTINYGGFDAAVGAHYPVVLRWLNRLHDAKMQPHWKEKWQYVPTHCCKPFWLKQTGEYSPQQLLAKLGNPPSTGAFVSFAYAPPRAGDPRGDALSVALSGGTPVAVWWRECDPDPAIAQNDLQALLTQKSLEELPDVLKNVRNLAEQANDPNHPGCRLAILFDNHDHRPPQLVG